MANTKNLLRFCAVVFLFMFSLCASDTKASTSDEIGIDDSFLGTEINMDLKFKDEDGKLISLAEASRGKPILLSLVYYNCTSICSPFLNGIADMVRISPSGFQPGDDYTIISVSFDPKESHEIAKGKKQSFLNMLGEKKKIDPQSWRFLTGSQENINELVKSVGFHYTPDGKEFKHASALIAISPTGKIARYMRGLSFLPLDVNMAVYDASQNKWAPTIKRIVKFCFTKDPQGRGYYFNFVNVVGALVLITLAFFILALLYLKRQPRVVPENSNKNPQEKN